MNAPEALARLRRLRVAVISTRDAAAVLRISASGATRMLGRLASAGVAGKVRHGLWWVDAAPDPLTLPEFLVSPYPAYVSLQSALYLRGMISQIPEVTYVVSLAWPERITTSLGVYSIHRTTPELFDGFEQLTSGAKLASAEKALFDLAYLSGSRTKLFAKLPELELPPNFDGMKLGQWLDRVKGEHARSRILRMLSEQPALKRQRWLRALQDRPRSRRQQRAT